MARFHQSEISQRSRGTIVAAVLVLAALAAGAVVLLLGRSSLPQLPAAAAVHICPACPAAAQLAEAADCPQQSCPECPPAAAAAGAAIAAAAVEQQPEQEQPQQQQEQPEQQQQQPEQQHQQQDGVNADAGSSGSGDTEAVPLLCGGPGAIPAVDQALAAATSALDASLEAAFAPFEKGFTLEDLMHTADALGVDGAHDTMVWVEVRNQSIVFPRRHGTACRWFCNEWVRPLKEGFERGMREGCLRVPDGLPMLWNVYDYSGCKPGEKPGENTCTAPLLSIIKWSGDIDVPVPPFGPLYEPHWAPWEDKADVAFFRGTPWCNVHGLNGTAAVAGSNCSREHMPLLSLERPDLLNVTLTRDHGRAKGTPGPQVTHADHARFKYLVNLDGITASRRLATVLSINSLVLKQESGWQEWYYAALRPCVHFLPFWQHSEQDILPLVEALQSSPANQVVARAVAANAYTFSAAHFNEAGVYRYWQKVVDRYVQLYRGPADATAAAKALKWAEAVGRRASKHGEKVEAECWKNKGGTCWYAGRDAAKALVQQEREKAAAAAAADSSSTVGTEGGAATAAAG